ncbi:MAG: DUF3568 family protein [Deltaproteobacteria bacterium]|nr:DUF3568 family protein [Deltaproteobacteria bacterium]
MNTIKVMVLTICIMCCTGCAPLLVGGVAATAGTGTYIYIEGELKRDYHFQHDEVWNACEKVFAQLNATNVVREKDVGKGKMSAVIEGENVWITSRSRAGALTSLGIRVGYLGDRLASQRLHDMVAENLAK